MIFLPVDPPVPADPVEPHQDALAAVLTATEVELRAGVEFLQPEHQHSYADCLFKGESLTERAGSR